jgi:hypothetical protein
MPSRSKSGEKRGRKFKGNSVNNAPGEPLKDLVLGF